MVLNVLLIKMGHKARLYPLLLIVALSYIRVREGTFAK